MSHLSRVCNNLFFRLFEVRFQALELSRGRLLASLDILWLTSFWCYDLQNPSCFELEGSLDLFVVPMTRFILLVENSQLFLIAGEIIFVILWHTEWICSFAFFLFDFLKIEMKAALVRLTWLTKGRIEPLSDTEVKNWLGMLSLGINERLGKGWVLSEWREFLSLLTLRIFQIESKVGQAFWALNAPNRLLWIKYKLFSWFDRILALLIG